MPTLTFEVTEVDFAALADAGDFRILQQFASLGAKGLRYPLLGRDRAEHVSVSPFMDIAAAAASVAGQNPTLPPPDSKARYVVAGQQAGLLTGPLYTFLKAVSAISIARALSDHAAVPILPLFWTASEDHDVLEVNRVTVNGQRFVLEYPSGLSRGKVPQVADIPIGHAREALLRFLENVLPATEFTPWVLDLVSSADFTDYAAAFRDLMRRLFADWELRLVDPRALRPLTAPVLAALVESWTDVEQALARGSERLGERGFEPPLAGARVFEIVEGNRTAVEIGPKGVRLSRGRCSLREAASVIRRQPNRFSPGAALRPVCQDAVLPVVATLGGPAELLYLWQIMPIYDVVSTSPSLRFPRISATFVEPRVGRAAAKVGLAPDRIFEVQTLLHPASRLRAAELTQTGKDVSATPDAGAPSDPAVRAVEEKGMQLLEAIDRIRPGSSPRWLCSSREAIASGISRIVGRLQTEKREAAGLTRKRLEKIAGAVLPEGKPQERVANVIQFLNLHGRDFIDLAVRRLDPFAQRHQVVVISTEPLSGESEKAGARSVTAGEPRRS